jgi:hypothetical protein
VVGFPADLSVALNILLEMSTQPVSIRLLFFALLDLQHRLQRVFQIAQEDYYIKNTLAQVTNHATRTSERIIFEKGIEEHY